MDPPSEDEEPYPQDQQHDGENSDESWDDKQDDQGPKLPVAALNPDADTLREQTSSDEARDGMLARDIQRKTAYYDYAAEKQLTQADAKLFYQRSQLEGQMTGGSNWGSQYSPQASPVIAANGSISNLSNFGNTDLMGVQRSRSTRSIQSGQNPVNQSVQPRENP